jgi:hypothetical protein
MTLASMLVVVFGVTAAACGGRTSTTSGSTSPARDAPSTAAAVVPRDGSLGDANSARACTLLDAAEIEAQFGGPVGAPTPIFPYCQWIVGDGSAFVAVTVIPAPMDEVRRIHTVRSEVDGVGDDAYIASTRAIVFGANGTSYSILWQKVGDFTTVETERLRALALHVLARV